MFAQYHDTQAAMLCRSKRNSLLLGFFLQPAKRGGNASFLLTIGSGEIERMGIYWESP